MCGACVKEGGREIGRDREKERKGEGERGVEEDEGNTISKY